MTTTGVREALAVLPTWRAAARFVAGVAAVGLLRLWAAAVAPLALAACGYLLAGPWLGLVGVAVGVASASSGPAMLATALLGDAADRVGRAVLRAAADQAAAARAGEPGPDDESEGPASAGPSAPGRLVPVLVGVGAR
ncbi:hypothetical protein GCM10012275_63440 [Longimycelium tulufanense]|uniref:Uncharacterized protein n=1 Tax=Longimycelium tulufanense TaxID=907463 RepID=A0A8J3FX80_9PSEU|nr:hypothetical protein [Longimycelium tulufanense]GGM84120.1 hypothetical protein GCM10012275_63440 [Longimycelium tulufanense]